MGEEMRERSFDELAKGLASGTLSRGKALRLMGAALVGGALASLPGAGWASHKGTPHGGGGGGGGSGGGGGKSSCAKYCKTLFGGDTAAQEECVSQGTKGTGPCYSCSPGAGPGPNFTPSCPEGQEFDASSCKCAYCRTQGGVTHCCPADEGFTARSVCISPLGGGTCCAQGEDCNPMDGTCCENLCGMTCCAPGLFCDISNFRCCEYGSSCLGVCCAPGERCLAELDEQGNPVGGFYCG
jgi:hypothetical protein